MIDEILIVFSVLLGGVLAWRIERYRSTLLATRWGIADVEAEIERLGDPPGPPEAWEAIKARIDTQVERESPVVVEAVQQELAQHAK